MKMIFSPTCFSLLYFILVAVRTSAAAVASPSPSPSPVPKSEYFLKTHLNGGSVFASPVRTPSGLWVVGWSTTKESATSVTFDGQGHLKFNTPTPLFFSFDNSTITPAVLFVTLVPGGDILTGLGLDGDRLAWSGGTQTKEGWMSKRQVASIITSSYGT
ncbi:hypothetical protein GX50_01605 [[Emmonsia] crescens]|uniref:Uncharacterized protein n=1 Tax=[Emmonsia] crescens TaxID=73230 RepID=A0A2B7ZQN5_9EURO|nr:hypothetical protein GX50_01605 [Emmonsia crescens]